MSAARLTSARVGRLRPRRQPYAVRDPAFWDGGVHVLRSGPKCFVRCELHAQSGIVRKTRTEKLTAAALATDARGLECKEPFVFWLMRVNPRFFRLSLS